MNAKNTARYKWLFPVLGMITLSLFLIDLALGSVDIPLTDVANTLIGKGASKENWTNILIKFRMPKGATALLAGMGLAASGLQMQALFRNPLAGPFVLGISAGASLGVALLVLSTGWLGWLVGATMASQSDFGIAIAASVGATGILALIMLLARKIMDNVTLLIVGLMLGYLTSAIVSILMYVSSAEEIQSFIIWTFGSFSQVTRNQLWILALLVVTGLFIALFISKWLNALLLGDTYAKSLGIPIQRARLWIIISTGLMAGSITAFCGPIAFLGIAIPHLTRALFNTSNHYVLIPAVIFVGAITALICDIISQIPGSQLTLPINAITSLIGAPIVIWVIIRMKNIKASFAG